MRTLVNETNLDSGTYYYEIYVADSLNFIFQYKLISSDADNSATLKFYATLDEAADKDTNEDWVDITNFLGSVASVIASNRTESGMFIVSGQACFVKIKIELVITNSSPNNSIKIIANQK